MLEGYNDETEIISVVIRQPNLNYGFKMKFYLAGFLLFFLIPIEAISHSGGTDSNGCHAGSQPYHCHNSNNDDYLNNTNNTNTTIGVGAWDVNVGYQYQIEKTNFIPFIGASLGKSEDHETTKSGINLGIKLQNGWYTSYVTTSKSIQLGYEFVHISANPDYIGIGIRFPFLNTAINNSSVYSSASILFSGDESDYDH